MARGRGRPRKEATPPPEDDGASSPSSSSLSSPVKSPTETDVPTPVTAMEIDPEAPMDGLQMDDSLDLADIDLSALEGQLAESGLDRLDQLDPPQIDSSQLDPSQLDPSQLGDGLTEHLSSDLPDVDLTALGDLDNVDLTQMLGDLDEQEKEKEEGEAGAEAEGDAEDAEDEEAAEDEVDDEEEDDEEDDEDEEEEEEDDDDDEEEEDDDEEDDDDDEEEDDDDADETKSVVTATLPPGTTFRYPLAPKDIGKIPERERKFKMARFLPCAVDGCDCSGLEPPSGSNVVLDTGEDVEMGDGDDEAAAAWRTEEGWWRQCGACSHGWEESGHVFSADVSEPERTRREKVAGRIEEMLEEEKCLTTFPTPRIEATESLRRQLSEFVKPQPTGKHPAGKNPVSRLRGFDSMENGTPFSEDGEDGRPRKRMRTSASGSRSPEKPRLDESPNGEANGKGVGKQPSRGGKKKGGKGTTARTIGSISGASGGPGLEGAADDDGDTPLAVRRGPELDDRERRRRAEAKEKERQREDQAIARAAGDEGDEEQAHVDVNMWRNWELPILPLRPAAEEQVNNEIRMMVASSRDPDEVQWILLVGAKNLFMKQLPKMPREYIARLVLDPNHITLAIVKYGYRVVGGICYRPFERQGFAEIVFCAVDSSEQVKGYGSHVMNALKDHVRKHHPTIDTFLTYADNYAVGYFKKQGFKKEITYPRKKWVGYIKDYEGGTIMQCTMLPKVVYAEVNQMLADQKAAVAAKIRQISQSHVVRPGLEVFKDAKPGSLTLTKDDIPGLSESGWNPDLDEIMRQPKRNPYFAVMQQVLNDLQNDPSSWPFVKPVDSNVVVDYYNVIANPMDLSKMEHKLENNHYNSMDDFISDARLIFANCRQYNGEKNQYANLANKLEKQLDRILKKRMTQ